MERDWSEWLYEMLDDLNGHHVTLQLENGREITGAIVAFGKGDADKNEPSIITWRIVPATGTPSMATDAFGMDTGELVQHKRITAVTIPYTKITKKFNQKKF